jgi:hypothetical protein
LIIVVETVVEGEDVESEVAGRVAPHRVRVVGTALGVVPFDQQVRALDPVVVGPAWIEGSGPGDVHGVEDGAVVAPQR